MSSAWPQTALALRVLELQMLSTIHNLKKVTLGFMYGCIHTFILATYMDILLKLRKELRFVLDL